jgi:hypothetical protein
MTKSEMKEFKGFVRDTLMREYKMNELEAYRAVQDSYLSEALQRDSDYVEHDTVEEWAEFIFNEVSQRGLLRM